MNLRNIKKKITYELGAFLEDCSVVAAVGKKEAEAQIENLMNEAIELHEEFRDKVIATDDPEAISALINEGIDL